MDLYKDITTPNQTLEELNKKIITRWNDIVKTSDTYKGKIAQYFKTKFITVNHGYKYTKGDKYIKTLFRFLSFNISLHCKLMILCVINRTNICSKLLSKNDKILDSFLDITSILMYSSSYWTFSTYNIYMNYLEKKNIQLTDAIKESIAFYHFSNTDDRLYVLHSDILENKKDDITFQLRIIDSIGNIKNDKYCLRRLKYISKIFTSMDINMLLRELCISDRLTLFEPICKYYYNDIIDNNIITSIVVALSQIYLGLINSDINAETYWKSIYNILKTDGEKNVFIIYSIYCLGTAFGYTITNINDNFSKTKECLKEIFTSNFKFSKNTNIIELKNMFDSIPPHEMTDCIVSFTQIQKSYWDSDHYNDTIHPLLYIMPFVYVNKGAGSNEFNKIKYYLTKYIKNVHRKKAIIRKIKIYPILNELKNMKPNHNVPVFRDGTYFYKNKSDIFNEVPPYHIYPGMLQNMKDIYLVKEKPDGILVNKLPQFIEPILKHDKRIKAEYIENLDLYLVFDIEIDGTTLERHKYIHSSHKYGQKTIPVINSVDDFIREITKERQNLKTFLEKPYDNCRWYPKPAWIIENMENFIKMFTHVINDIEIIDYKIDDINYDGFIITPLNGQREIKIKPKKYHTIDLLYKNNKWYDRDNIQWTNISTEIELSNNIIYRCYPDGDMYIAKEIRFDKIKPNTHIIANTIIGLYKAEFKFSYDMIYHKCISHINEWDIIKDNTNTTILLLLNRMKKLLNNPSVLDCGCGNIRGYHNLKKTNYPFNKYIGVDIDINMLGKVTNIENNMTISYMDLGKPSEYWYELNNSMFNLILCINSLMHFCTDYFWETINMITENGSFMIVSLVDNIDTYNFNEYYIKKVGNMIKYKFPIHDKENTEPFIEKDIFSKYGWNIFDTYKSDYGNLSDCYIWYILQKD